MNSNGAHDFHGLGISDLLEARAAYHLHLAHLRNVVGTAIGLYLIRDSDPDDEDPDHRLAGPGNVIRTLFNSLVKIISSRKE